MFISINHKSEIIGVTYEQVMLLCTDGAMGGLVKSIRPYNLSSAYLLDKAVASATHKVLLRKLQSRK